jgi:hypothetical protein
MDERRQLARWEIKEQAVVWIVQTQELRYGVVDNMHLKGMRLSLNKPLPLHQELSMSLTIGNELSFVNFEARIPWEKQSHGSHVYGLTFTNITDETKKMMYRYINTNCYEQFRNTRWAQGPEVPLFISSY